MSANVLIFLAMGGAVGFLSGMFGVGGGFLMTPLLIFAGIPAAVAVGTETAQILASSVSGALAQWRRRNVDVKMGSGAAGRRPGRLGGGRAAGRRAAPLGRVRCVRRRLLRHLSWRHRHPDADRKHQHHTPGARRQDRCGAPLRSAQLGARAAAQDALSPLQALHQRHTALAARAVRRSAGGHHGCGRRLHHGAGDDLPAAHADQRGGRHLAVPDRVSHRRHHGAACLAEPERGRGAGGAS